MHYYSNIRIFLGIFWNKMPKKLKAFLYLKYLDFLDRMRLDDLARIYTNSYFEWHNQIMVLRDVEAITSVLYEVFNPKSVVDFGCGIGSYLYYFSRFGVKKIQGYEGSPSVFKHLMVNPKYVKKCDLRDGIKIKYHYDLCLCLEVLEHISSHFEDIIINSLYSSSDSLCISCATPQQGGHHHINERPHRYWIKKFKEKGHYFNAELTNEIRRKLKKKVTKLVYMPENLMIFQKNKRNTI